MPYKIISDSFNRFYVRHEVVIAYENDGVGNLTLIELLNQLSDVNPLQERMLDIRGGCNLTSEVCDLLNKKATNLNLQNCEFGEEIARLSMKISINVRDYSYVSINENAIDITMFFPKSIPIEYYQHTLQIINLFFCAAKKIRVQLGYAHNTDQLSEKQKLFLRQLPKINQLIFKDYILTADIHEILRPNLSLQLLTCEANADAIQCLANNSAVTDLTLEGSNLQNWTPVMRNPALRGLELIYLQARNDDTTLNVLSKEIISALASHPTLFVLQLTEFTSSQSDLTRLLQNTNLRRLMFYLLTKKPILDPETYQNLLLKNKNLLEHKAPDCYVSDAGQIEAHLQANRTRYDVIKITSAITAGLRTTHAHPFRDSLLRPEVVSTIFGFAEEEFINEKLQNELKQKSFAQKFPFFAKLGHFVISRYCTAQVASPPDTPVARLQQN